MDTYRIRLEGWVLLKCCLSEAANVAGGAYFTPKPETGRPGPRLRRYQVLRTKRLY